LQELWQKKEAGKFLLRPTEFLHGPLHPLYDCHAQGDQERRFATAALSDATASTAARSSRRLARLGFDYTIPRQAQTR
jgi:hypothetical protein